MQVSHKFYVSLTLKSLLHGEDIIHKHALRRVGNGESIDVWNDRWGCLDVNWREFANPSFSKVKDFIWSQSMSWKVDVL